MSPQTQQHLSTDRTKRKRVEEDSRTKEGDRAEKREREVITEKLAARKAGCIQTGKCTGEIDMASEEIRGEIKEIRTKLEQVARVSESLIREIQEEREERKEHEREMKELRREVAGIREEWSERDHRMVTDSKTLEELKKS